MADRIFSGQDYLLQGSVLVLNERGILKDVVPEKEVEPSNIERLEGIITPGFVNAHCHLELSHLKNKINRGTGLPAFAKEIVKVRHTFAKEIQKEAMQEANAEMWNNGIVAVGDISNNSDSFEVKASAEVYYYSFIELIGLRPELGSLILEKGLNLIKKLQEYNLKGSLAPHAPYSTSKELIELIGTYNHKRNASLSIHNQESEEETKFFNGEPSGFDDLYTFLNLDMSWYKAPGKSSLSYYAETLPDTPSILVHNTVTTTQDMDVVKGKNIFWCFCPGANRYIEEKLPNFSIFSADKNKICIGTDSLASNSELNLIKEANRVLESKSNFSTEDLLRAITYNGARALGIEESYGQIIPGRNSGLNLISTKNTELQFINKIA